MAGAETDCKSAQQGSQSSCSELITFYLILTDALTEALHSGYCYPTNKSCSARQAVETQPAAALELRTRSPGKFRVAGSGLLFRRKTDFLL